MSNGGRSNGAISGRAEKHLRRNLIREVETADSTRGRNRNADHEQGRHQERSRKWERNMKCPRREPDTCRDRDPQGKREHQRRDEPRRLAHHGQSLRERLREPGGAAGQRGRQHALDAQRPPSQPFGMTGQRKEHRQGGQGTTSRRDTAEFDSRELPGIVGHDVRNVKDLTYELRENVLVLLYSDGIHTHWSLDQYLGLEQRDPALIAGVIYRDHRRGRDDTTVVVARGPAAV